MTAILERHAGSIQSTLSCFDRLLIQGTVVDIGHPEAITFFFNVNRRRIFDFKEWAKPYRDRIHDDVKAAAAHAGLKVEFVKRPNSFRKEDRIAEILKTRGTAPGVVHVFEVMENCMTYEPWHDKASHRTYFRTHGGKCAHYYVYFIDEQLGLCHLRIPTWAPFRLQFCLNGHNWLANELEKAGIQFTQVDNAFVSISDVEAAQFIANGLAPKKLHRRLDDAVRRFAPALRDFKSGIHWSLMQVEYSTDLVFSDAEVLKPMYEEIVRTLVHAVQPEQVAMFLGKRLDPRFEGELGSSFVRRTQGLCLRHFMSSSGIKIYDKFGHILRIECFTNDVNFFKHHRRVEHRDGTYSYQTAPVRKSIYSLCALSKIMGACNKRYLAFLGYDDILIFTARGTCRPGRFGTSTRAVARIISS
jgi:hypothetical protein